MSRLTPVPIAPLSYPERLQIAKDLITYNFKSYKIAHLQANFSETLIKQCLTQEGGVRGLKDNIERIAYKVFLLNKRNKLPTDGDNYQGPIINKLEVDNTCPFAKDKAKSHKESCECFKAELIPGWVENMQGSNNA